MPVKLRPYRHQDVADNEPDRRRPHQNARQSHVASGATNQADGRRNEETKPSTAIRIGKPAGSTGFEFQTCNAVSAAAKPSARARQPRPSTPIDPASTDSRSGG